MPRSGLNLSERNFDFYNIKLGILKMVSSPRVAEMLSYPRYLKLNPDEFIFVATGFLFGTRFSPRG